ncbi:MAG: His/Gly/Thr/Pro-type tRNA ligase C-terminal domain-containing protein [Candidatus Thermoplasmatota archaeon]|nr:His/Gly/Thr/Pro-type tRNA ligase C-terminal domain-containing protein [Candidatus Thermoplasmatota archaeon]
MGIPWAVTIDHTTLQDGTVTIRRRDDQLQVRVSSDDLHRHISNSTIESLF